MLTRELTEQEIFWKEEFGNQYTNRNNNAEYGYLKYYRRF